MKKIKIKNLDFKKVSIMELNAQQMYKIVGGTSLSPLKLDQTNGTTGPKEYVSLNCSLLCHFGG